MIQILKGKTISEFIIWLFGVAKKHDFDICQYQNGIPIEFDLNKEFQSLVNARSRLLVLSKIDIKTGLTLMDHGRIFIDKVDNGTRVEFKPIGYFGYKEIEPIIDEFAEHWVNLKYSRKKKLVIDDVEKFKLDLVEEFNKPISANENNLKINDRKSGIVKKLKESNLNNPNYPKIVILWNEKKTARDIGKALNLTEQTINNYISEIRELTGEELIPKRRIEKTKI